MMNARRILLAILGALLATVPSAATAADQGVSASVAHYVGIGDALSQDSVEGIQAHAKAMLEIMDDHLDTMNVDEMEGMTPAHENMAASLKLLAVNEVTLDEARVAYKALSEQFISTAQTMYEKSDEDPDWAVMSCPMAKAEWIQVDGKVSNPYYGSKMLRCGKKVSALETADAEAPDSSDGADHHDHHGGGGH